MLSSRDAVESFDPPTSRKETQSAHTDALIRLAAHFLDSPISDKPALAPCMLACAAQLLAGRTHEGPDTDETCRRLVLVAESCSPITAVQELLSHESLATECPGVFADAIFYTIGTWCRVFSLRPSTMEKVVLYQFLAMMSELLYINDGVLTACAALTVHHLQCHM